MAKTKMSADRLNKLEISHPVLTSATSSRVSPTFRDGTIYSSTDDLLKHQIELKQKRDSTSDLDGLHKIQTKYASPDNLQTLNMNTKITIANIESQTPKSNGSSSAFSDTSSDVSDNTVPILSNSSGSAFGLPVVDGVTEENITQVDMFYRSHKTEVKVCRSLANLYVSAPKQKGRNTTTQSPLSNNKTPKGKNSKQSDVSIEAPPDPSDFSKDEWEFSKTGIPVLILDTGEHVREKRLKIILAEKGTGFTLWQDQFNHFTEYRTPHENFHTITLSTDSTRLIGLSFDEGKAATDFAEAVRGFTNNADDDLLNLSKKKKKDKNKQKYKPPKKVDISQPVCFVHVTKLERPNLVGDVFPPPPSGAELRRLGISRALSESSGISEGSTTHSEH